MSTRRAAATTRQPEWTLQDKVRKARVTAGLDQDELAERSGISRNTISNYENGVTTPRRLQLRAIADACQVPYEWLTGVEEGVGVNIRRLSRRRSDVVVPFAPFRRDMPTPVRARVALVAA